MTTEVHHCKGVNVITTKHPFSSVQTPIQPLLRQVWMSLGELNPRCSRHFGTRWYQAWTQIGDSAKTITVKTSWLLIILFFRIFHSPMKLGCACASLLSRGPVSLSPFNKYFFIFSNLVFASILIRGGVFWISGVTGSPMIADSVGVGLSFPIFFNTDLISDSALCKPLTEYLSRFWICCS